MLLTDDGRVPEALLDPAKKAPKVYEVDVAPRPSDLAVSELASGVVITTTQQRTMATTTAPTLPCDVERVGGGGVRSDPRGGDTLRFTLREGRNRQIRKMCEAVGCEVTRLHRTAIGELELGDLEVGGVRRLEGAELAALQEAVSRSKRQARGSVAREGGGAGSSGRCEKRRVSSAPKGWGARIAAEAEAE